MSCSLSVFAATSAAAASSAASAASVLVDNQDRHMFAGLRKKRKASNPSTKVNTDGSTTTITQAALGAELVISSVTSDAVAVTPQHRAGGDARVKYLESMKLRLDNDVHTLFFLVVIDLFGRKANGKSMSFLERVVVCVLCPFFVTIQLIVAASLLAEETGIDETKYWHAFTAGTDNKKYQVYPFLLFCVVFTAVFPDLFTSMHMMGLVSALRGRKDVCNWSVTGTVLGLALIAKMISCVGTVCAAIVVIYKTPDDDGILTLVKFFLAVAVPRVAEMDNLAYPYVVRVTNFVSGASAGKCTDLEDQVNDLIEDCPVITEENKQFDLVEGFFVGRNVYFCIVVGLAHFWFLFSMGNFAGQQGLCHVDMSKSTWNDNGWPITLPNKGYVTNFLPRYCTNSSKYCEFAARTFYKFAEFEDTKCGEGYDPAKDLGNLMKGSSSSKSTSFADGNVDSCEDCDDGNTNDGDGCSASCTTEINKGVGGNSGSSCEDDAYWSSSDLETCADHVTYENCESEEVGPGWDYD